jgi:hypothetical protein
MVDYKKKRRKSTHVQAKRKACGQLFPILNIIYIDAV